MANFPHLESPSHGVAVTEEYESVEVGVAAEFPQSYDDLGGRKNEGLVMQEYRVCQHHPPAPPLPKKAVKMVMDSWVSVRCQGCWDWMWCVAGWPPRACWHRCLNWTNACPSCMSC